MSDDKDDKVQNDLEEKKRQAMLAMEGERGRELRQNLERKKQEEELIGKLRAEKKTLAEEIAKIAEQKEKLELKWIEMNETKSPLEKSLAPIVADEIKIEKEEYDIEAKEKTAADTKERQATEKMRWEIDDRRRATEKDRWRLEDEISKINDIIKANSEKYQALLAEEEKGQQRLNEISKNLSVYGE